MKLLSAASKLARVGSAALLSFAFMGTASAEADYPDRTVSWVIPFPPGGPTDIATRVLAEIFTKELGETFVSENRAGASGSIGVRNVIRAKPDGYTISTLVSPSLTAPFMQDRPPYDLETDIQPIGLAYETPLILVVNPDVLPEVIDIASLAKAGQDGKELDYTAAGIGSTAHLTMELMKSELDFSAVLIPFQGSAPAVSAVLAGEVPVMLSDSVAVLPHIKAGKLRPIALTSDVQIEGLEDVKTMQEQGVQSVKARSWGGIFAPRGTPQNVIDTLSQTLKDVLHDPDVRQRMTAVGAYPVFGTPEEMAERIKVDSAIWKQVIEDNNIRP